jgi:hypothetical protein
MSSSSATIDLANWIEKLKTAKNRTELFAMLDSFRVLEWTDEQRSTISKLYMRLIDVLPHIESAPEDEDVKSGGPTKPAEQEEVWYEKM